MPMEHAPCQCRKIIDEKHNSCRWTLKIASGGNGVARFELDDCVWGLRIITALTSPAILD